MDLLEKTRFSLTFETRGEANDAFLENIDPERADENIDFFHICEAYHAIENWFSGRDGNHKLKLLQHFLNDDEVGKNVKVIWFQLSDKENAVDAFTRLNVGKIPLTDDELIRALFLRREQESDDDAKALQLQIAHEWDQLEKSLQSDPFWYFISNEVSPKKHNRIRFLFDFVARSEGLPDGLEHDTYVIFHAYNSKLKNDQDCLKREWLKIKQAYMMLEEWYEDRTLYHITGFLIQQGFSIAKLRELSENNTKSDLEQKLRQQIFETVIDSGSLLDLSDEEISKYVQDRLEDLEYDKHKSDIRKLLLLFNIATLLDNPKSNIRFQFDCFKNENWDIEHVRSLTQDSPRTPREQKKWLEDALDHFLIKDNDEGLEEDIRLYISQPNQVTGDEFEALYRRVLKVFKEDDEHESDHGIANLALLDQNTNRSYKNAVFAVKREKILTLDRKGIFVPLCTRNVFLKCYSSHVDKLIYWTKEDQAGYQKEIRDTLVRFFKAACDRPHG